MSTAPDESLSLQEAKEIAQRMESEIAAMVPKENVAKTSQHPTGVLMSCSVGRSYQWTGATVILLKGTLDVPSVLASISANYADKPGFTPRDVSEGRSQLLQILSEHGASYVVGALQGGAELRISSFSPCFLLPRDVYPGGEF